MDSAVVAAVEEVTFVSMVGGMGGRAAPNTHKGSGCDANTAAEMN